MMPDGGMGRVARVRRVVVAILVASGFAAAAAGCTSSRDTHPAIAVDASVSLVDRPIHLRVSGLRRNQTVTVSAQTTDLHGARWQAHATFDADDHGVVDLARAAARSGTYSGVDGMGLFWSMDPPGGTPGQDANGEVYWPPMRAGRPVSQVRITVTGRGIATAATTVTRQWMTPGESVRGVTLAADGVVGHLLLPAPGSPRRPAVLCLGGSEGGEGQTLTAALLAAHGYPALAAAYFAAPGLPATIRELPLEYLAGAARLLGRQPGVDVAHVVVLGQSLGTGAALLLNQYYPSLVHGAVLFAPTATIGPGLPDSSRSAWSLRGRPLPIGGLIPLDRVSGPVLAVAGRDDFLLPASTNAGLIMQRLDAAHDRYPHRALVYADAGHEVGTYPYTAQSLQAWEPLTDRHIETGGTRAGDAAAQAQAWPAVLAMLDSLTR